MATAAECADHLFLTERRFKQLLDEGVVIRRPPSQYVLDDIREQYIKHVRGVAAGRGSGNDLAGERARLAKQQADAQQMKNEVSRGDLLPKGEMHIAVTDAFARVRAKLLAIPSKLAPLVFGALSIAEIRDKLTDVIHEALAELSITKIVRVLANEGERSDGARGAGLVGGVGAAAEPDGQPMGRSRAAAKPRGKR